MPVASVDCPIDDATRQWVDARASWILHHFGRERVTACTIVLPTEEFFPNDFGHDETAARGLFDQLCRLQRLDPGEIELVLFHEDESAGDGNRPLGIYEQQEDRDRIWIEESLLEEPLDLAATIAHELCHVHLLGHGRLTVDEDDHEPLTDLLTVFLGIGIITSNSALFESYWHSGVQAGWRIGRPGYLTMPTFGYALALFSKLRDDASPMWQQYLRPDVRRALKMSLTYLEEHGMPNLRTVMTTDARPTRLQADDTEDEPELAAATAICSFCGVKLPYRGICDDCRESIEENKRELELEREQGEISKAFQRRAFKWAFFTVALILFVFLMLQMFGVT